MPKTPLGNPRIFSLPGEVLAFGVENLPSALLDWDGTVKSRREGEDQKAKLAQQSASSAFRDPVMDIGDRAPSGSH